MASLSRKSHTGAKVIDHAIPGNALDLLLFGSLSKIAGTANDGCFTITGVDPRLTACVSGEVPRNDSLALSALFAHANDGDYPLWADLSIITPNAVRNQTVAINLGEGARRLVKIGREKKCKNDNLGTGISMCRRLGLAAWVSAMDTDRDQAPASQLP